MAAYAKRRGSDVVVLLSAAPSCLPVRIQAKELKPWLMMVGCLSGVRELVFECAILGVGPGS